MKAKLMVALATFVLTAGPALAQGGAGPGPGPGPGPRARAMRNFDPSTVTTVTGDVTAVHKIEGRRNQGVHVDLQVGEATYDVHLGPASFLASKKLDVKKGDRLEVTGSKLEIRGKPALIAQTVKKGDSTVSLRDAQGTPAWARRPKK